MALRPWKILSSKHVYPNVRIDHCELPDGQVIEGFVLEYHDWATVVALTPDNQVVMERQYRHGIQKILLELPGGVIDDSDASPLEAARRELLEETGYTSAAAQVEHLVAGFQFTENQHFLDNRFRRRVVGRQLLALLRVSRSQKQQKDG